MLQREEPILPILKSAKDQLGWKLAMRITLTTILQDLFSVVDLDLEAADILTQAKRIHTGAVIKGTLNKLLEEGR